MSKNPTLTLKMKENSKENEIPNSISTLTHLHTFKLIGFGDQQVNVNSITSLHNQIQTCIIQNVRLTPNMNDKSNPIYTLTKLQHLELIRCEISELNETISNLTSLQTLLLSYNFELNGLPSSMTKLTSLLHFSLNWTNIQSDTLISVVCQLPSLQVLELDGTQQFETLSSQISQLTLLQHLSLSSYRITSLPTQLGLLTQLHTLNLDCCDSLNNIPTELEHLTNLREFRLRGTTKINKFSLKMKNWIKLEVLVLNSLNIEMIPSEVWMMTKLRHLSLNDNKLSFIPSELYCLSNLTHLDLSYNKITHISNQINKLTQLQYFEISSNQLTQFPDDISSLLHLSELRINNNKLKKFPSQLPSNLARLNLNENLITSISSTTFSSLTRLERLELFENQITILPTQIGLLTSLQELNLNNNKLSFIPSDLVSEQQNITRIFFLNKFMNSFNLCLFVFFQCWLSNLSCLSVSSNKLTFFPNIHLCSSQKFYFSNNPLKFPLKITGTNKKKTEFLEVYCDLHNDQ
jgi:leucine-rich repeat protein SHOC2